MVSHRTAPPVHVTCFNYGLMDLTNDELRILKGVLHGNRAAGFHGSLTKMGNNDYRWIRLV